MIRAFALLMLASSTMACGAPASDGPMAITDVIANIDALDGRTIQVRGYLGECRGYDCRLFRSPSEKAQADTYFNELVVAAHEGRTPRPTAVEPPWLGIGSGDAIEFDRKAAPYTNGYVVITGRVTNACRYNGQPGCTDRSTDLEPMRIERWSSQEAGVRNSAG